jgi:hypothetical protein
VVAAVHRRAGNPAQPLAGSRDGPGEAVQHARLVAKAYVGRGPPHVVGRLRRLTDAHFVTFLEWAVSGACHCYGLAPLPSKPPPSKWPLEPTMPVPKYPGAWGAISIAAGRSAHDSAASLAK